MFYMKWFLKWQEFAFNAKNNKKRSIFEVNIALFKNAVVTDLRCPKSLKNYGFVIRKDNEWSLIVYWKSNLSEIWKHIWKRVLDNVFCRINILHNLPLDFFWTRVYKKKTRIHKFLMLSNGNAVVVNDGNYFEK